MNVDHQGNFNFLALSKFRKHKKTIKTLLNRFLFSLELRMYYTPLTCYEQENLGHKAHFEAFSRTLRLLRLRLIERWITKIL